MNASVLAALAAAVLFGASTPFAKALLGATPPILLAGLLYGGSGIGLAVARLVRDRGFRSARLAPEEWPWLLGAILTGGVLGPVLLMYGLERTTAADASLLLNLEAVLTAILAWFVFRENTDRRIVLGMALIVAGGALLRAYFSTAPFVGAAIAIAVFGEPVSWPFWAAAALMAGGVSLHLTEVHEHEHVHEPLTHAHAHRHDAHHQHLHDFDWDGREPHTHPHSHEALVHRHPHYPDVHHRHGHARE
jgi:drug/metabolite transporter (DMT)-like permease